MMTSHKLFTHLNETKIVQNLINMLEVHTDGDMVKAISSGLLTASHSTQFYPDLLSDRSLQIIITKIINYNDLPNKASLDNLYNTIENVLKQSKTPIKYLLATSILKITESNQTDWTNKKEANIVQLLEVLYSNIQQLNAE